VVSGGHFALRVKRVGKKGSRSFEPVPPKNDYPVGWGSEGKIQKKPRRLQHRGF
jgi:hypothetical protein